MRKTDDDFHSRVYTERPDYADLETSAHLNRKQEQEIMICPVCGRKIDKWIWRTTCCGAELVWAESEVQDTE